MRLNTLPMLWFVLHNLCELNGDNCDPEWTVPRDSQVDASSLSDSVRQSTSSAITTCIRNAHTQHLNQMKCIHWFYMNMIHLYVKCYCIASLL